MNSKFRILLGCLFCCWGMVVGISEIPTGRQKRVVDGELAKDGEFPWQVLLSYYVGDSRYSCGGCILSKNLILTAAHCVSNMTNSSLFHMNAGVNGRNIVDGNSSQQLRFRSVIHIHEDFDKYDLLNDIAIVEFVLPLEITDRVKMVTLPRADEEFSGYVTASGLGRTEENGTVSDLLKKVELPIVPTLECKRMYKNTSWMIVTDKMMCAGGLAGKNTCKGDSGGPIFCKQSNGLGKQEESVICGIISQGYGCGREGYPGVYTRVSKYKYNTSKKYARFGKWTQHVFAVIFGSVLGFTVALLVKFSVGWWSRMVSRKRAEVRTFLILKFAFEFPNIGWTENIGKESRNAPVIISSAHLIQMKSTATQRHRIKLATLLILTTDWHPIVPTLSILLLWAIIINAVICAWWC